MRYLPVFLDLQSGKVLLVGAGELVRAKLRLLVSAAHGSAGMPSMAIMIWLASMPMTPHGSNWRRAIRSLPTSRA